MRVWELMAIFAALPAGTKVFVAHNTESTVVDCDEVNADGVGAGDGDSSVLLIGNGAETVTDE
jgi:hypothetical protein